MRRHLEVNMKCLWCGRHTQVETPPDKDCCVGRYLRGQGLDGRAQCLEEGARVECRGLVPGDILQETA